MGSVGFYGGHAMNSVRNTAHSILSHFVYCFSFCLFQPLTRHLLCCMYDNGAGCAGYDSRGCLTHAWRIFRVNGLPPSLSLSSWVGRQGQTVVYINGAFPPSCTLRIETLTHSPLHCAHAKPFVRCSLRRTTYVRNSRPPPASANSN